MLVSLSPSFARDAPDALTVLNDTIKAVEVDVALGGKRCDDRRYNAGETGIHEFSLIVLMALMILMLRCGRFIAAMESAHPSNREGTAPRRVRV